MITFAKIFNLYSSIAKFTVMNIVDRLKSYMDYIGMASTQFADVANIPRPTISQILNGRNRKISNEVIEKLHLGFPDLNIMWLLFGDGDMEVRRNNRISEPQLAPNISNIPTQSTNNNIFTSSTIANVNSPLQSSTIDDFMNDTMGQRRSYDDNTTPQAAQAPVTPTTVNEKKIRYIMVFFSDNSFEVLTPS